MEPPAPVSFDDYVRDHQVALVRYATLLSGSQAQGEDLVQEVLVRLYRRWDRLVRDGSAGAYVRRCITNEFLSTRRRWSTRHIHLVDDETLHAVVESDTPADRDEVLWQALLALPGQQRAAVALRYYEGLGDAEIGDVLNCRPATVRGHVSRGLASMRASLGHLPGGNDE